MEIDFIGKSFCFTGIMAQLKRSYAEREVRARLGFTQKIVNPTLDYLVIGSIPSIGWKYGEYGNKIQKARNFIKEKSTQLLLISEHDFMESLERSTAITSGDLETKLVIVRYKSLVNIEYFDKDATEQLLAELQELGCHITASLEYPFIYQDLYNQYSGSSIENSMYLNIRIVFPMKIEGNSQEAMDSIAIGFEAIKGLNGDISFSEKKEGSASYITLLQSIPQNLTIAIAESN